MKHYPTLLLALLLVSALESLSQPVYMTRNGKISFFSKTPLENIDAVNNEVFSALNTEKGDMAFSLSVKAFHFERSLMEEHFNENYMESEKFPKSTFSGKIDKLADVHFDKEGKYTVTVTGDLTIHGVTKRVTVPGSLNVEKGKIEATAAFQIKPDDYGIKIPTIVIEKIAEVIDVSINCHYEPKSK